MNLLFSFLHRSLCNCDIEGISNFGYCVQSFDNRKNLKLIDLLLLVALPSITFLFSIEER